MSTSRPPLILRMTRPLTSSPSLAVSTRRCQLRMRSALRLLMTTRPLSDSTVSSQTSTSSPTSMAERSSHSSMRHHAFALEADVDDHVVADDADDAALEDGAGLEIAQGRVDGRGERVVGGLAAHHRGQFLLEQVLVHVQRIDQVVVYHLNSEAFLCSRRSSEVKKLTAAAGRWTCRRTSP